MSPSPHPKEKENEKVLLPGPSPTQPPIIRLPHNFLLTPPPRPITKTSLNFSLTPIPSYTSHYATILDHAFTPVECAILPKCAQLTTNGVWFPAMVNVGYDEQALDTTTRDCGRIVWDEGEVAGRVWGRVKGAVEEIHCLEGWPSVTGRGPAKRGEVWRVRGVNERMRFLRYGAGQYFRAHEDGCYETPDGAARSYFTLHLYLSEGAEGGATTFHSWEDTWDEDKRCDVDVEPKVGRVLIFQQRGMLHSGAEVREGVKYTFRTDIMYGKEVDGGGGWETGS